MSGFYGPYRATVVNASDPEDRHRVMFQAPQLMGANTSGWALPIPATGIESPQVGEQVLVTFEGGDLAHPLYYANTQSTGGGGEPPTAMEILNLLKEVDGQGSGLDADMLQGKDASYYATGADVANLETRLDKTASIVRIDSSRGVLFKSNNIDTQLNVTVFRGDQMISDVTHLRQVYGVGAYVEWQWQRMDEETFGTISAADSRISNGGFTLTLTPDDVDTKTVFRCILNGE